MSLLDGDDEPSPSWQPARDVWPDVTSPMAQDPDSDEAFEIDSAMGLDQNGAIARNPVMNEVENATARMSNAQKTEYIIQMLKAMDKQSLMKVNKAMQELLRIDPIHYLPVEIINQIIRYLDPKDILRLGSVSKHWRLRTLDSRLWRKKYLDEGWEFDTAEIEAFERGLKAQNFEIATSPDSFFRGPYPSPGLNTTKQLSISGKTPPDQDDISTSNGLQAMLDWSSGGMDPQNLDNMIQAATTSLILVNARGKPRLNYFYIFRSRMMLENNWTEGKYTTFQIPSPEHPRQAHIGCCYSIHFSRRFLVSGSRDMSIGIWDLSTQTLVRPPLLGHTGSVLCVQFDESPDEDIIMSGSSDTCVIIWRFSTGEMLRKLERAHDNSVLNLKFDKRYLVTCSKDRLIKIWNREALLPTSDLYPQRRPNGGVCADFILDLAKLPSPLILERDLPLAQQEPVPPYSVIMTINSHSAAVNAVVIREDKLVSISGDKTIKIFDIKTGVQKAQMKGHRKGIACLSYDGHRIVTGSSDQTIKIFDPISKGQTQTLGVHNNLVRTLQAHFVDYPTKNLAKELQNEAKLAEKKFLEKAPTRRASASDRIAGRAGRDLDFIVPGCSIPPDGGGNKWSKIVSGSYDETVIVWRKSEKGWAPSLDLKQVDVLKETLPESTGTSRLNIRDSVARHDETYDRTGEREHIPLVRLIPPEVLAEVRDPFRTQPLDLHPMIQAARAAHRAETDGLPRIDAVDRTQEAITRMQLRIAEQRIAMASAQMRWMDAATQDFDQLVPARPPDVQRERDAGPDEAAEEDNNNRLVLQAQRAANHVRLLNREAGTVDPAIRVYKLQFDARCIIDCSQTSRIIGWDFADGNVEILNCVRFFAAPPS